MSELEEHIVDEAPAVEEASAAVEEASAAVEPATVTVSTTAGEVVCDAEVVAGNCDGATLGAVLPEADAVDVADAIVVKSAEEVKDAIIADLKARIEVLERMTGLKS